jgi:hypothetical protein
MNRFGFLLLYRNRYAEDRRGLIILMENELVKEIKLA